jgi:hypothetical protein
MHTSKQGSDHQDVRLGDSLSEPLLVRMRFDWVLRNDDSAMSRIRLKIEQLEPTPKK